MWETISLMLIGEPLFYILYFFCMVWIGNLNVVSHLVLSTHLLVLCTIHLNIFQEFEPNTALELLISCELLSFIGNKHQRMMEGKIPFLHSKVSMMVRNSSLPHSKISNLMIDGSYDILDFNYTPYFPMVRIPK